MRRIQITIDEPVDDFLELEARRTGTSKAALIRGALAKEFPETALPAEDGWAALDGCLNAEPVDDIDSFLYGPTA